MPTPPRCCGVDLESLLDAELFKSLADPVRLQVVLRLALGKQSQTVTEVQECCGVHLSGVSRHLRQLREAGVVQAEKTGREVRYVLRRSALSTHLRTLADALDALPAPEKEPSL